MITLLTGDNGFALKQELQRVRDEFVSRHGRDGLEQLEADDLEPDELSNIFKNTSLFSVNRLVILREIDDNKALVERLPDYLEEIPDDVHLLIVSAKPDKRTRWYKLAGKLGKIRRFDELNEPDLIRWAVQRADRLGAKLDSSAARVLVELVGLNQWRVDSELTKLATYDSDITRANIELQVEQSLKQSVFDLLDAVVKGKSDQAQRLYDQLLLRDIDAHQFIGLLSWQLHNLLVVKTNADVPAGRLASQAGLAPFVVNKTGRLVSGLSLKQLKDLINLTLKADADIKRTGADVNQRIKVLIDEISLQVAA